MKKINLWDYYPFYTSDSFIEVSDEVAAMLQKFELHEAAYRMRTYRHKAYYSLDRDDGVQHDILFIDLPPDEIYERKVTIEQLHSALASLPEKQAKRIYAHYFLGISKAEISRLEGVNRSQITRSISKALKRIKAFLKDSV